MRTYSLGIVQSHATQFDGPLFRKLAEVENVDLTVYYTRQKDTEPLYDPELARRSGWDHDITSGYQFCLFPSDTVRRISFARKLVTAGHDLIVVAGYNSISSLSVAILGKVYGVPVGLRADSVSLYRNEDTLKWKLKDLILPLLYALYSTGHPTGSLTRSFMLQHGFEPQELFYFPYAADNEYLKQLCDRARAQRDDLRREMGIGSDSFVVIGVLKFVPREDPLTLLHAFDKLSENVATPHLILVGDGPLRREIEEYIERRNLRRVHLPGYVSYTTLPTFYAIGDVFVHPARVEPWGVSVNEAMACGLPPVVADTVGAGADLVKEGETGFTFPAGDAKALAKLLKNLLDDQEGRQRLSRNATKRVEQWSYDATIDHIMDALRFVCGDR